MTIIAVEEHLATPEAITAWDAGAGMGRIGAEGDELRRGLLDVEEARIAAMDAGGVDVQVISLTCPGLQAMAPAEAAAMQVATNDRIAAWVGAHPDRLQGFATLATPAPEAAVSELRRAVTDLGLQGAMLFGRTGEVNLDDGRNWGLFEAAEALGAPLYIHPQPPQDGVRRAIYSGLGEPLDSALATFGIGWHYESGIQFLRLCLAGVFDRFPGLQVILGHWGEVVLFFLERADGLATMAGLDRSLLEYAAENLYVSAGGVYSHRYMRWAGEVVGIDRLLFATDYPYRPAPDGGARAWLAESGLSEADQAKVAAGNWERLVGGIRR